MAEDAPVFVISVAAELAGMHAQTLRQYDRLGLVRPGRTAGGGRRYSPRDVALLREVQRLSQEDGVNLAGIKRIIELESRVEALQHAGPRAPRRAGAVRGPPHRRRGRRPRRLRRRPGYGGALVPLRPSTSALVVWRPRDRGERGPADDTHEAYVASSGRSGCCCAGRGPCPPGWRGEIHPDLDGAAYGLLALLADAGPLRATDLVVRLGAGQEHGQPPGVLARRPRAGRAARPTPPTVAPRCSPPRPRARRQLARIREARRARWEEDLSHWPVEDVASLGELLGRFNRLGEAQIRGTSPPTLPG